MGETAVMIWDVSVEPANIDRFISHVLDCPFVPESEECYLAFDLVTAVTRYGWDRGMIAAHLLPGREHWGSKRIGFIPPPEDQNPMAPESLEADN